MLLNENAPHFPWSLLQMRFSRPVFGSLFVFPGFSKTGQTCWKWFFPLCRLYSCCTICHYRKWGKKTTTLSRVAEKSASSLFSVEINLISRSVIWFRHHRRKMFRRFLRSDERQHGFFNKMCEFTDWCFHRSINTTVPSSLHAGSIFHAGQLSGSFWREDYLWSSRQCLLSLFHNWSLFSGSAAAHGEQ